MPLNDSRSEPTHVTQKSQAVVQGKERTKALGKAPPILARWRRRGISPREKSLLTCLLSDPRMESAWKEIDKRLSANLRINSSKKFSKNKDPFGITRQQALDVRYFQLWRQIGWALRQSAGKEASRKEERVRFQGIAVDAQRLASRISDGPLDRLAYEYFHTDLAIVLFRKQEWSNLPSDQKAKLANRRIDPWPSMTDLLMELAEQAQKCAEGALTRTRIVDRDTQDRQSNYFIRHMTGYFRENFGGPMHGVVAAISSVVLTTPIDEETVKRALRHVKHKGGGA